MVSFDNKNKFTTERADMVRNQLMSRQAFDETESGNSLPRILVVPLANHTGDVDPDPLSRTDHFR